MTSSAKGYTMKALLLFAIFAFTTFCGGQKVLVTSGWSNTDYAQTTEVIDLANAANKCQNLASLSKLRMGAMGGLSSNKYPTVCGGVPHDTDCEVIGGIFGQTYVVKPIFHNIY